MTQAEPNEEPTADEHLADLADGCGCAEVWEHLSERRAAAGTDGGTRPSEAPESEADAGSSTSRSDGDSTDRDAAD